MSVSLRPSAHFVLLLVACGGGSDPECELNSDCGSGFYCASGGVCMQDCVVDGDCAGGQTCDIVGRCRMQDGAVPPRDAGSTDGGTRDAGPEDAGMSPVDGGPGDGGPVDGGMSTPDAGPMDAGPMDAGPMDAGPMDAGMSTMDAGPPDAGMSMPDAGMSTMDAGGGIRLLISEYVEGSGLNKAIEIVNLSGAAIDLAAESCVLDRIINGGTGSTITFNLSGTVAPGEVHVVCQSNLADPPRETVCDQQGAIDHNGDDAYVVACDGTVQDSFGQSSGVDPGDEWVGGGIGTKDRTLRRKCSVSSGDTDVTDAFDPSVEWDGFDVDTFDGLGTYGC